MSDPSDKFWRRSKFQGEGWISTEDDPQGEATGSLWTIQRMPAELDEYGAMVRDAHWIISLYRGEQERQITIDAPMKRGAFYPDIATITITDGLAKELGMMRTALGEDAGTGHLQVTPRGPGESAPE